MILAVNLNPAIDKIYFVQDFKLGAVHRPTHLINSPGGKGSNVARVAKQLGAQVMITGFIGGATGQFIESELAKIGIEPAFLKIEGESRICINITDEQAVQCTEVLEPGPTLTMDDEVRFLEHLGTLMPKVDVVTLSGSLPVGISKDFYAKMIQVVHAHHKKVLLDTSGEALIQAYGQKPDLLKPNQDEIAQLMTHLNGKQEHQMEQESSLSGILTRLLADGIQTPIVTLGKEGALAILEDGVYQFILPPISVVNTVGSGDAFLAGCAVAMDGQKSPLEIVKLGMACGAANTQFSQTGYVTAELVNAFKEKVCLKKIVSA